MNAMTGEIVKAPASPERQRRIVIAIFAVVCGLLALGYYLFLRVDYAVIYSGLKPADAAAIIAELDAKGIGHRLRDDGTTILVPADQADDVRLAVAGSDIPLKGSVGFELFNKSDMGLTDFAQKINYQRALQGELARTIMSMEGIETARVHLAMPERSLFRANRSTPKAAIEVQTRLGEPLGADRVAGIQSLVAAAVPDLPLGEVVVLDGRGRIISPAATPVDTGAPVMEEQAAAQQYYSARAKSALARLFPGVALDVKTLMLPLADAVADGGSAASEQPPGKAADGSRNFRLRMTVLSTTALDAQDQALARTAIGPVVGFDERRGDSIAFELGPISAPTALAPSIMPAPSAPAPFPTDAPAPAGSGLMNWWTVLLGILFLAAAITLFLRLSRPDAAARARDMFVDRVRQRLRTENADG